MTVTVPFARVSGVGDPTLVFVHGFSCAHEDWDAAVARLSGAHRCVAIDLPGHGHSPLPARYSIEALAAAVNDAVAAADLSDVVLVGHSLGTKVVRACCRQASERVRGLVLVDGSTYVGDVEALVGSLRRRIAAKGMAKMQDENFRAMLLSGADPAMAEGIRQRARRMDPDFAAALLEDSIRWDIAHGDGVLRSLAMPVLLLQSTWFRPGEGRTSMTADARTPFMDKIERLVARPRIRVLTGTGHFPMIERPDEFAAIMQDFLASL